MENENENEKKFPLRPIGDRFIAKVVEGGDELNIESNSEFILPKNNNSKPMKVVVVEISNDFVNDGIGLKVGDIVLISKYGSTSITYGKDNEKYQLCNRMDIIGVL